MSDYTFKPKVNKKSEEIVKVKTMINMVDEMENVRDDGSSPKYAKQEKEEDKLKKFELLYLEALKRKQKQAIISNMNIDEECTFKPKLISKKTPRPKDLNKSV